MAGWLSALRTCCFSREAIHTGLSCIHHSTVEWNQRGKQTLIEHEVLKVTPEIRRASSGMDTHLKKIFIYITKGSKFG